MFTDIEIIKGNWKNEIKIFMKQYNKLSGYLAHRHKAFIKFLVDN